MSEATVGEKQASGLSKMATLGAVLGVIGVINVLAAIFIPNLIRTDWPPRKFSRAAGETKAAATQAFMYASDNGVYPASIKALLEGEIAYCACSDKDPWGNDYVLSPVFTEGRTPREGDHVYVFSRGPKGTGVYPQPFTSDTGEDGAIGYSSVDGCFGPEYFDVC